MRKAYDAAATRAEIRNQVEKLVAWSKNAHPRETSPARLGKVSPKDLEQLSDVTPEVVPGIKDVLEKMGDGRPVAATRLIDTLVAQVDAAVTEASGSGTLDARQLKKIPVTLRPLALRALAYAHTAEFGSFADTSKEFYRLEAEVMGQAHAVLTPEALALVDKWLAHHNRDTAEVTLPVKWQLRKADLTGDVAKAYRRLKKDGGSSYAITAYRHPKNDSVAVYAASTNGPNTEHLEIFDAAGKSVAVLRLIDDGGVESTPDFPKPRG